MAPDLIVVCAKTYPARMPSFLFMVNISYLCPIRYEIAALKSDCGFFSAYISCETQDVEKHVALPSLFTGGKMRSAVFKQIYLVA